MRNGQVSATRIVTDDDHLILISDRGKLIRLRVGEIKVQGRATQGVRLMRVDDGEHVAAIERLAEPGETSGIAEGAPIEAVDDNDTVPNEPLDDDPDDTAEAGDNGENGDNGDDEADDSGDDEA
jgi:DNA gyrase subunit A